jgi:hypothetical protein
MPTCLPKLCPCFALVERCSNTSSASFICNTIYLLSSYIASWFGCSTRLHGMNNVGKNFHVLLIEFNSHNFSQFYCMNVKPHISWLTRNSVGHSFKWANREEAGNHTLTKTVKSFFFRNPKSNYIKKEFCDLAERFFSSVVDIFHFPAFFHLRHFLDTFRHFLYPGSQTCGTLLQCSAALVPVILHIFKCNIYL